MTDPSLSDLRARVLAGETLTTEEVLHVVRRLRDERQASLGRARERAQSKRVDLERFLPGAEGTGNGGAT